MSNLSSSKKLYPSLSDLQILDLDSPFASINFEQLGDDPSKTVDTFERDFLLNSPCPQTSTKTFYPESRKTWKSNEVDDLIQSHISRSDESSVQNHDCNDTKSIYPRISDKVTDGIQTFKTYPSYFSKHPGSPTKISDESSKDKKSKTHSTSFPLGQILTRKSESSSIRTKSPDNFEVENMTGPARSSLFKKQSDLSSSLSNNVQQTQVKTKLRTMWNNMKYGWRVKREVNLKLDSATWLLGQCYHNKLNDVPILHDVAKELKLDLLSRIWLTYRINFPTIPGTDLVSDSGWGCMLRCGQMMMAQALVCHFLNREWRVSADQPPEKRLLYKMILRWFGDSLSEHSIFSLHHLVSLGENYGRKAGDWYGPTHAAQVLRDALIKGEKNHPQLKNVCMYVALDGIVFKQDVMDLCLGSSTNGLPTTSDSPRGNQCLASSNIDFAEPFSLGEQSHIYPSSNLNRSANVHDMQRIVSIECSETNENKLSFIDPCPSYTEFGPPSFNTAQSHWTSLILFVSVRLGNDKINPFYIPCLKSLLAYEHCIGIIGGRPKHALYFIGWQEDKLIHMDPHSCQPAIDVEKEDFNEKSFHSSSIRTMSFTEMDPSCAIGFYFRRKEELLHFIEKFSEITAPMKKNLDYPVFALAEGKRKDIEEVDMPHAYARSTFSHTSSKTDEDDYILL